MHYAYPTGSCVVSSSATSVERTMTNEPMTTRKRAGVRVGESGHPRVKGLLSQRFDSKHMDRLRTRGNRALAELVRHR
jgi:hypothetical protein